MSFGSVELNLGGKSTEATEPELRDGRGEVSVKEISRELGDSYMRSASMNEHQSFEISANFLFGFPFDAFDDHLIGQLMDRKERCSLPSREEINDLSDQLSPRLTSRFESSLPLAVGSSSRSLGTRHRLALHPSACSFCI